MAAASSVSTAPPSWPNATRRTNWIHGHQYQRAYPHPRTFLLHQLFSHAYGRPDAGLFVLRLSRQPRRADVHAFQNLVGDCGLDGGGGTDRRALRLYRAQNDLRAAMVPAQLRRAAAPSRQTDRWNRRDHRERMAHPADDRAQAERHGSRRAPRHLSAGAEAARPAGAGRPRTDTHQRDRLPGIARETRSARKSAQADAAEDGHENLRGDESARRTIDRRARRGEFAKT